MKKIYPQFIYFLRADTGLLKIGRSTNVKARISVVKSMMRDQGTFYLEHVLATDDNILMEKHLHYLFKDEARGRELFDVKSDDKRLVPYYGVRFCEYIPSAVETPGIPQQDCDKCEGSGKIAIQDGLGEQMRKYRVGQGLSLREVARRINKSAVFVSQLETGQAVWSNKNIELYFSAFNKEVA